MRRHNRIAYDLIRGFNAASLRRNWRLDIEGAQHLDARGPAVLAFNHGHIVDGTVIIPFVPRRIRFLCDHRALMIPVLAQILHLLHVIPIHVRRPHPAAAACGRRRAIRSGQPPPHLTPPTSLLRCSYLRFSDLEDALGHLLGT